MIKHLLVIRFSALGDVAMTLTVLKALANQNPDLIITVLSRQQYASLFENLPNNIRFFGADLKGKHKGVRGLNILFQEIDYKKFDAIADMHNVIRSRYLDLLFRVHGKKVAVVNKKRYAKWKLARRYFKHIRQLPSVFDLQQQVYSQLGITIKLPHSGIQSAKSKSGIGIAPFAAHKGKMYPFEKMEKVVQLLTQQTAEHIYLFGAGEQESNILQLWADKYDHVHNLAGKHNLQQELEIIGQLRIMLTMDSANMHLASLAGTPAISIWGATHPFAGFIGYGMQISDCIQHNMPCRPCSIFGNKKCRYGDYRCFNNITPQSIVNRILCE